MQRMIIRINNEMKNKTKLIHIYGRNYHYNSISINIINYKLKNNFKSTTTNLNKEKTCLK